MTQQGSKRGTTNTFLRKIILVHPDRPILLNFMLGPPKHLLGSLNDGVYSMMFTKTSIPLNYN